MNQHSESDGDQQRQNSEESQGQFWCGAIGLLEIVVTTAIVVGFFSAASQPLGWKTGAQLLTCCALSALLLLADARLESEAPDGLTSSSATG